MRTGRKRRSAEEKLIVALSELDYLTAEQATRLLYAESSFTHVREKFKKLVADKLVIVLGGRAHNLPRIFTLSTNGRKYAEQLGKPAGKRYRLHEEQQKQRNLLFMLHTLAVNDVLIAARLLSQSVPDILLSRMLLEREVRGNIAVTIPIPGMNDAIRNQRLSIEPDASLEFLIHGTWRDFFHIEVYRNLPPIEQRFKQKIQAYVAYAQSSLHQELFQTAALSIAILAATNEMAVSLKRWTEAALAAQQDEGSRFYFTSMNPAAVSPVDLFLSPGWKQAFGEDDLPLIAIDEDDGGELEDTPAPGQTQ
jgi:Replication-relaxation